MKVRHLAILMSICFSLNTNAANITIDADLADLRLHPTLAPRLRYLLKGQAGFGAHLLPGFDGQADAGALYETDSTNSYFAGISPGTLKEGAHHRHSRGVFELDFGGNGALEWGMRTIANQAGSVFGVSVWEQGLCDTSDNPFRNRGGFTHNDNGVSKGSRPLKAFSGFARDNDQHWPMNYPHNAATRGPNSGNAPAPDPAILLSAGLLGLLVMQRNNQLFAEVRLIQPCRQTLIGRSNNNVRLVR
ncbi:MAG: hypothetical protein BVN35_09870 [Proteobacteria bacterium ST_bin11]|nr:MAG: hypothetical protein BVN35_09870 [Proteobacteria bacterium ST_bin11]